MPVFWGRAHRLPAREVDLRPARLALSTPTLPRLDDGGRRVRVGNHRRDRAVLLAGNSESHGKPAQANTRRAECTVVRVGWYLGRCLLLLHGEQPHVDILLAQSHLLAVGRGLPRNAPILDVRRRPCPARATRQVQSMARLDPGRRRRARARLLALPLAALPPAFDGEIDTSVWRLDVRDSSG